MAATEPRSGKGKKPINLEPVKDQNTEVGKTTPQTRSFWSKRLILLSVFVILVGLLFGAELAGWLDLKAYINQFSSLGQDREATPPGNERMVTGVNLLEKENRELKKQLQTQQALLEGTTYEKQALEENKRAQEQRIQELERRLETKETEFPLKNIDCKQLAVYYAEMKPNVVVSIMEKLDDEVVFGILKEMEPDYVAKIFAAMHPERAAELSKLFTTTEINLIQGSPL